MAEDRSREKSDGRKAGGGSERDLHPLELELLEYLSSAGGPVLEARVLEESGLPDEGSFRRASQWLLSRYLAEESGAEVQTLISAGPLGLANLEAGTTPELALLEALDAGSTDLRRIQESDETFERSRWGSALGALLKQGLVERRAEGGIARVSGEGENLFDRAWREVYVPLAEGERVVLERLSPEVAALVGSRSPRRGKGRAEFVLSEHRSRSLAITPAGAKVLERARSTGAAVGALSPQMIADGSWRSVRFRRYELDIPPSRIHLGRLHPYRQFLDRVRRKFISMGFVEMTGPLAESEFWNNDALFMPQYHPARDIHDAYYLPEDLGVDQPDERLMAAVAEVHESGGSTGGRGWGYAFSRRKAGRAILRSQGTALSARCLASDPEVPGKYFALARCFRYDQVDATHLPDFFQIEGIVLGERIGLRQLLGLLRLFAEEIAGASEYRFTPGYFPFTEPSVEMHVRHPTLGWVEGGGAGLFRPEVRLPLGVEVPVIAWGLGLDRLAMLALGLSDIRDLVTPDLAVLREMRPRPDSMLPRPEEGRPDAQDRG